MRKTLIIMSLALIGAYLLLSVVSSSDEYTAERLLYHAVRINAKLALNPDVVPPVMQKAVERNLNLILTRYAKTNVKGMAHLALAEFYLVSKKYDKAQSILDDILEKYKDNDLLLSKAQYLKGFAYEKQDRWDAALKEYIIVRDKYTHTQLGLGIPLYIARYYFSKGMQLETDNAYRRAVLFYKKIELKNRGNAVGYASSNLLLQTYLNLREYEEAGKVAEDAINNYPSPSAIQKQLVNVEMIYIRILKRPVKAIEIFSNVKEKIKDQRFKKFLEEKIKIFEEEILVRSKSK